jgi:hypothetical protein
VADFIRLQEANSGRIAAFLFIQAELNDASLLAA